MVIVLAPYGWVANSPSCSCCGANCCYEVPPNVESTAEDSSNWSEVACCVRRAGNDPSVPARTGANVVNEYARSMVASISPGRSGEHNAPRISREAPPSEAYGEEMVR